jgi:hypothetical protein
MIEALKQTQQCLKNKMYAHAEMYLHEAIAELESQEPVAHRDGYWCTDLTCKKCYSADFRLKHTTHPPQRRWQGLSNEQIDACWNKDLWKEKQPHHIFAKAIEAKLKEKNT